MEGEGPFRLGSPVGSFLQPEEVVGMSGDLAGDRAGLLEDLGMPDACGFTATVLPPISLMFLSDASVSTTCALIVEGCLEPKELLV